MVLAIGPEQAEQIKNVRKELTNKIDHCAVPKLLVAGDRQFDRDVRGGAHYPRGSVG